MRIGIVGSGAVGQGLGRGWAKAGHAVRFGSRDPEGPKRSALGKAGEVVPLEAAADAEVVLLALPWTALDEVLPRLAEGLAGRIVIDATNPLAPPYTDLAVTGATSGAEVIASKLPGAALVKAFNSVGSEGLDDPRFPDGPAFMPVAGDDAGAKRIVIGLAQDLGFDAVDAGPLTCARYLEPLAMLWIKLALVQGLGRGIAFRLARR